MALNWASNHKLKVGFMTSDFRKHPMAYLFINMFRFVEMSIKLTWTLSLNSKSKPVLNRWSAHCLLVQDMAMHLIPETLFRMLDHQKLHVVCIMTYHNDNSP